MSSEPQNDAPTQTLDTRATIPTVVEEVRMSSSAWLSVVSVALGNSLVRSISTVRSS